MIKVGDKVRVIFNGMGAWHPTEVQRYLKEGDIITVGRIHDEKNVQYLIGNNGIYNTIPLKDVELIEELVEDKCICDIIPLVNNGCKCGFLQREKELI